MKLLKEVKLEKNNSPLFETHCHLDTLKNLPMEEILLKCQEEQINKIVTIAVQPDHLDQLPQFCEDHHQSNHPISIYCTQGIHPHEAQHFTDQIEQQIIRNTKNSSWVVALGEMGLDYHYDFSPRAQQRKVFEKQLQLAIDLNLPVVIHTREADEDTLSVLKNFGKLLKKKGVFHSFTSSPQLAEAAIQENFYIGINGIVTFKNAEEIRRIVEMIPLSQIVLETDAPYLTPVPHRGKENAPFYLPFIAGKVAEIKKQPLENILQQVYINSLRLFSLT